MINEDEFRIQMDRHLKAQGIKKAERNRIIEDALVNVLLERRECRIELERQGIHKKRKNDN